MVRRFESFSRLFTRFLACYYVLHVRTPTPLAGFYTSMTGGECGEVESYPQDTLTGKPASTALTDIFNSRFFSLSDDAYRRYDQGPSR